MNQDIKLFGHVGFVLSAHILMILNLAAERLFHKLSGTDGSDVRNPFG